MKLARLEPWFFAGLFVAVGFGLMVLAYEPSTAGENAPPWIIAASGAIFAVAGLAILVDRVPELDRAPEFKRRLRDGLGLVMVLLFALIANWIAFGPGERSGEVSFSLPLVAFTTERGDWLIRAPFACSAVFLNLLTLLLMLRWCRAAITR